jgi:hypothetical protein
LYSKIRPLSSLLFRLLLGRYTKAFNSMEKNRGKKNRTNTLHREKENRIAKKIAG